MLVCMELLQLLKYLSIIYQQKGVELLSSSIKIILFPIFFYHLYHNESDGTRRMYIKVMHQNVTQRTYISKATVEMKLKFFLSHTQKMPKYLEQEAVRNKQIYFVPIDHSESVRLTSPALFSTTIPRILTNCHG